jgi:hypothetical protein
MRDDNPQITQIEVSTGSGSDRVLWQDDLR